MPEDLHTTQKRRISVHLCFVFDEDTVFGDDNLLPVFPLVERYALQTLRRDARVVVLCNQKMFCAVGELLADRELGLNANARDRTTDQNVRHKPPRTKLRPVRTVL
jgi:hypothetical protein